ncbi:hypothetical protein [Peribacillus kribbensis]|uniref:hypothetical protein n=1 Tax=Peribacillus kribbensis TaxID=356658 RepID=UPI000414FC3D|nr:hypothetical protein [Peribacillus kribbensis]
MLVLKYYFLSDIERFNMEREILESSNRFMEEDLYNLDDRELKDLHSQQARVLEFV